MEVAGDESLTWPKFNAFFEEMFESSGRDKWLVVPTPPNLTKEEAMEYARRWVADAVKELRELREGME